MTRPSLKSLANNSAPAAAPAGAPAPLAAATEVAASRNYRTAQTRSDTRQVGGHFKPEVAQTLRLIAVEQDRDVQEILAEALNMVFGRYGKATRAEVTSGRRNRPASTSEGKQA
jgi:hypothetical protein